VLRCLPVYPVREFARSSACSLLFYEPAVAVALHSEAASTFWAIEKRHIKHGVLDFSARDSYGMPAFRTNGHPTSRLKEMTHTQPHTQIRKNVVSAQQQHIALK
jgi:hypothetical protein